jgi:hypothetical protein
MRYLPQDLFLIVRVFAAFGGTRASRIVSLHAVQREQKYFVVTRTFVITCS